MAGTRLLRSLEDRGQLVTQCVNSRATQGATGCTYLPKRVSKHRACLLNKPPDHQRKSSRTVSPLGQNTDHQIKTIRPLGSNHQPIKRESSYHQTNKENHQAIRGRPLDHQKFPLETIRPSELCLRNHQTIRKIH